MQCAIFFPLKGIPVNLPTELSGMKAEFNCSSALDNLDAAWAIVASDNL